MYCIVESWNAKISTRHPGWVGVGVGLGDEALHDEALPKVHSYYTTLEYIYSDRFTVHVYLQVEADISR